MGVNVKINLNGSTLMALLVKYIKAHNKFRKISCIFEAQFHAFGASVFFFFWAGWWSFGELDLC